MTAGVLAGTNEGLVDGGMDGTALAGQAAATQLPFESWDRARTRRPSPRPRTIEAPVPRSRVQAGDWSASPPRAHVNAAPDDSRSGTPGLNQRRPQTHLASELLRPSPRPRTRPVPVTGVPDPRPAQDALSRFQASRQAAQAEAAAGRHTPENGGA